MAKPKTKTQKKQAKKTKQVEKKLPIKKREKDKLTKPACRNLLKSGGIIRLSASVNDYMTQDAYDIIGKLMNKTTIITSFAGRNTIQKNDVKFVHEFLQDKKVLGQ